MIPKSSDKYTAIVDSYNNFAYNYVSNIHMLKAVLLSPYTKDGKIIQDTQEVTGGSITTYYDIETEDPVAMVVEDKHGIVFYEKSNI